MAAETIDRETLLSDLRRLVKDLKAVQRGGEAGRGLPGGLNAGRRVS
jgi:hypothetical protein